MDRKAHWERVYTKGTPGTASWHQVSPVQSLALLKEFGAGTTTRIIDVGGGDATLAEAIIEHGLGEVTVLDVSGVALRRARERLGARAEDVTWMEADVTTAPLPAQSFDVWHDRAVFHFLTDPHDRMRYTASAARALRPGGVLIMATFAPDGPERCSGLEVVRYGPDELAHALGDDFALVRSLADVHHTPTGAEQRFLWAVFRRRGAPGLQDATE